MFYKRFLNPSYLMSLKPNARAVVRGSGDYPQIRGEVSFYSTSKGVIVSAQIMGLPYSGKECESSVYGFHIHSGENCKGNSADEFAEAMGHYNPLECPHPYHSGDLPPLFGNKGYAFLMFLTDKFTVKEILGKTVIIHSSPDDFTSQPSGNSGAKIACGVISR